MASEIRGKSARTSGKAIKGKEKELSKKTLAPQYLTDSAKADTNGRMNPDAYFKSNELVDPLPGVEEWAVRTGFNPNVGGANSQNFRLSEIKPEDVTRMGKDYELQQKSIIGKKYNFFQKEVANLHKKIYKK